jgi:biotin transporter BioY
MYQNTSAPIALVDVAWPGTGVRRAAVLVAAGTLFVALSAQLQIPLVPVPITGQTFGVLLVAAMLGSVRGAASVLAYIGLIALGLPDIDGGAMGMARFTGPTGGYLAGFVGAALLVGWLSERGWDRRMSTTALAMLLGTLVIYLPGVAWLSRFVGWAEAPKVGILPFLLGDILKVALATLLLPWGWVLIGRTVADDNRSHRDLRS